MDGGAEGWRGVGDPCIGVEGWRGREKDAVLDVFFFGF